MSRRKFHVQRETRIIDVIEVDAVNVDDALSLVQVQEGRILTTIETEPVVLNCWEKPTGISDSL